MIITVKKIDLTQETERKNGLNSYLVEFESELVAGKAILYSRAASNDLLAGHQISVEISQHNIHNFHVLPKSNQLYRGNFVPLSTVSDYEVTGCVAMIYDDGGFFVDIEPGRCSFALTLDQISPITVEVDNWVSFKVYGLEFWDEDY